MERHALKYLILSRAPARTCGRWLLGRWLLAVASLALACGETSTPTTGDDVQGADDGAVSGRDSTLDDAAEPPMCALQTGETADFLTTLPCEADFLTLASPPLVANIPGARSTKTVLDLSDSSGPDGTPALYFQNSQKFKIHWEFAREYLSGKGRPIVPDLSGFNLTEYYSPDRRFLLGAVTYYEGPGQWVYEIAPYDTASVEQITQAFRRIAGEQAFGGKLGFHPTSSAVEAVAAGLPDDIDVVTTDDLFAGIDYQPLNLGESYGKLRFVAAAALETSYVDFRDILVLDAIPNDLSPVVGTITAELQTPLAHINVLAQNRGTPNMGLRGALEHPALIELDGQWVRFRVGAQSWSVVLATKAEADAWWASNRPAAVTVPDLDVSVTGLPDLDTLFAVPEDTAALKEAIRSNIPAFGGKVAHYAALVQLAKENDVVVRDGFAVPVSHYVAFMEANGLDDQVTTLLGDPAFEADPAVRDAKLLALRDAIRAAPLLPDFEEALIAKITANFPMTRMRFRSSTNAEDLEGFTGAGLYTSKSGDPGDPTRPVADAVREVWASVWFFRAFEERRYRGIAHDKVAMGLLVHPTFIDELATGVALTANPFDATGIEPGFYVNVQLGDASVVLPESGETSDQLILQYEQPGQPVSYYGHSSLVPPGENVLDRAELGQLGKALSAIHSFFAPAYRVPGAFYAMDVEFKLVATAEGGSRIEIKQARPHPGRGTDPEGE